MYQVSSLSTDHGGEAVSHSFLKRHQTLLYAVWFIVCAPGSLSAQSAGQSKFTIQGPAEQSGASIVRDALNRPCLDTEAVARPHVVNPDILDHVVSVKNNCSRTISVKICYYQTDRCKEFNIQGYRRVDTILGTMGKVAVFRYSLSQK